MVNAKTSTLLALVVSIGLSNCGSEKDLVPRPSTNGFPNGNTIDPNASPSPSPIAIFDSTASLNIARNAKVKIQFPKQSDCLKNGDHAEWKLYPDNATASLESADKCEVALKTGGESFSTAFKLEGKFQTSDSTSTHTLTINPAFCAAGLVELKPNDDGSPQCRQSASTQTLTADHLLVLGYKYDNSIPHFLFVGSAPGHDYYNGAGKDFTVTAFTPSQSLVTMGHIKISGRNATIELNFCIDPLQPKNVFISPSAQIANVTGIFGGSYSVADYTVDTDRGIGAVTVEFSDVGLRAGQTLCGDSFPKASVLHKLD